jgi:hypothetical protein
MNELKASVSKMRLVQLAMIISIPMLGRVAEMTHHPSSNRWTLWRWVVVAVALWIVFLGSSFRRRMLTRAVSALAKDASDPKALKLWEAGHVVGMAFAQNIVLWGLVVRMVLGGELWQSSLFYLAGLFLLLFWTPRLPTELA